MLMGHAQSSTGGQAQNSMPVFPSGHGKSLLDHRKFFKLHAKLVDQSL